MKQFILLIISLFLTMTAVGQNSRLVKGYVQTEDGEPLAGAVIKVESEGIETISGNNGAFELTLSPQTRHLLVSREEYLTERVEIEGSNIVIRLTFDQNYAQRIALQKEQERLAAAQKEERERQEKLAAEKAAAEKARAEEDARLAKEKAAAEKAKAEEQARLAAEKAAAEKAKAEEEARLAKERAEEQARLEAKKKAEREKRDSIAKVEAKKKLDEILKPSKGFGSVVDVTFMKGGSEQLNYMGVTYTAGYRFNNLIYLGAGAGIRYNLNGVASVRDVSVSYVDSYLNPYTVSVPVFAYFKSNFLNKRVSPFFALATGASLSKAQKLELDFYEVSYSTNSLFVNPQLGVNFRTTADTAINFAVGLQCFTAPDCTEYTGYNAKIQSAFTTGLDFHLGFTF